MADVWRVTEIERKANEKNRSVRLCSSCWSLLCTDRVRLAMGGRRVSCLLFASSLLHLAGQAPRTTVRTDTNIVPQDKRAPYVRMKTSARARREKLEIILRHNQMIAVSFLCELQIHNPSISRACMLG